MTKEEKDNQQVEIQREVKETLFAQCNLVGVVVKLIDSRVGEIYLTWYDKNRDYSSWKEYLAPGGVSWLKDLHTAIGKMLEAIETVGKPRRV